MFYLSTRNNKISKTPSEAVLEGIAKDGGLYMPKSFDGCAFPMENGVSGCCREIKQKNLINDCFYYFVCYIIKVEPCNNI